MLLCPNCNHQLSKKTVKTSGSGTIEIDVCDACGGVYFDRGEVNRLSTQQAHELAKHDSTEQTDMHTKGTQQCPKCGSSLKRFWGESVPNDVYVLRCSSCLGNWFQDDELIRFKDAQTKKIDFYKTWKIPLPSLSTVMLPVALFVILAGSLWATVRETQKNKDLRSFAQDILTTPSEIPDTEVGNMTIVFTTKKPAMATLIFYHTASDTIELPTSQEPITTHLITVPNLIPGRTYQYQIAVTTGEESFTSAIYTFEY